MNPAADIWAKVLALMQNEMTTTTINTWFDDTTAVELEGDRFVLYSPPPSNGISSPAGIFPPSRTPCGSCSPPNFR